MRPFFAYHVPMVEVVPVLWLALALVVAHGANARLARLCAEDDITAPWREWLTRRLGPQHLLTRWAHCPWCCGWWFAWPVTAVAWFPIAHGHYWWLFLLAQWSVAHAAGRLNHSHG